MPREELTNNGAGECKDFMRVYLDCLRKNEHNSTPCRHLNRDYLDCRMNRCVTSLFVNEITSDWV